MYPASSVLKKRGSSTTAENPLGLGTSRAAATSCASSVAGTSTDDGHESDATTATASSRFYGGDATTATDTETDDFDDGDK